NLDGLLTSTTNRRQQIVARSYDALHRLLARSGTGVVADSFAYTTTGTVQVGWNAVSRDSTFTNAVTGWTDSVVTRFATSAGSERFRRYYRPTALQQLDSLGLTSPSTITLTGRRDFWNVATGQLDSIAVGASRFRMHFNDEGLPDTLTYPSGVKRATLYSSVHLPTRQAFTLTALDTVLSHSYRYDSLGQMLEDDHKIHSGANESMHVYSYDATGQLAALQLMALNNDTTCVTNGDFGIECADTTYAVTQQANTFAYDSVGNLRTDYDSTLMVATTGTYTTGDRQSGWGATHYTYDADGNRLTRVTGSDTVHFYWSPDGLMDSVRAGGATITYAYNAYGQLVRRNGHGVKRYFLWDHGQLLAELDSTATHRVGEYAYAPGTDAPIALVTGSGSGSLQQYVQDVNGNVVGLFTGSSSITERETYAPWGALEPGAMTALGDTNRLRWKGLVWEGDSTQLYYVRARWYDPLSRRFVSEDPLGVDGGVNPYPYAANDPVNGWDPAGLLPVVQHMDPVFSVDPCEPNGDYAEMFEFNVDCESSDAYINDADPAPPWLWVIAGGDGRPPTKNKPQKSCGLLWTEFGVSAASDLLLLTGVWGVGKGIYAAWRAAPAAAEGLELFTQLAREATSAQLYADYHATAMDLRSYSVLRQLARPAAVASSAAIAGVLTRSSEADYEIISGFDWKGALKDITPGLGTWRAYQRAHACSQGN
ncbi:MAG: RHS repeat-associated core domain-containing protein, partial [Gemmatimonadaceae bacterium]